MIKRKRVLANKHTNGYTIVELILVIALIGILSVIAVMNFGTITKRVALTQLKNDLLGAAASMEKSKSLHSKYPDTLPTGMKYSSDTNFTGPNGISVMSLSDGHGYCIEASSVKNPSLGIFSISSYGSNTKLYAGGCDQNLLSNNIFLLKDIQAGSDHACGLSFTNKLYCWGYNADGQLGDGTWVSKSRPVAVSNGTMPAGSIKSFTVGDMHTCAIASDDKVYCWGRNSNGQLGDGTATAHRNTPAAIAIGAMPSTTVKAVKAGYYHTCAIASDDKVYCWGNNSQGQLGNNNTGVNSNIPVAVSNGAMSSTQAKIIAASYYQTCVIAFDDKAYCWGDNAWGQLGNGNTGTDQAVPAAVLSGAMPVGAIKSISVGGGHVCVIASDDRLYCWGQNNYGQLGNNGTADSNTAVAVSSGAMPINTVKSIETGSIHSCAIAFNDKVYCWGWNTYGQLGDNTTTNSKVPIAVLNGSRPNSIVKKIASRGAQSCIIISDGRAYCWGYNGDGELGNGYIGTNVNVPASVLTGYMNTSTVSQISAAGIGTCAINTIGKLYCWGSDNNGQLGNGNTGVDENAPVAVSGGVIPAGSVKKIDSGYYHTCVIASDDKIYCWGDNYYGQLGNGNTGTDQNVPVAVSAGAMPAGAVKKITASNMNTCAIASDSKVYCWGDNYYGQLGNGNTGTDQNVPVAVSAGAMPAGAVSEVTAGNTHTCAIASDGKVYCWGDNSQGQLGNGNTGTNQNVPVAVSAGAMPAGTVKAISAGVSLTCAIASDSRIYCWGDNSYGQLGNGNTGTDQNTPVAVSAGVMPAGTVKAISVGDMHVCAIASDDKVYCWGYNNNGQLGTNNSNTYNTPVAVNLGVMPNGGSAKVIAAGAYHTCAIAFDDKAYCWGYNALGAVGSYSNSGLVNRLPGLVLPPL